MLTFLIPTLSKVAVILLGLIQSALSVLGVPALSPSIPQTPNPYLASETGAWVVAHRLGKELAPENTMMAVQKCLDEGYPVNAFEMDIQLTRDGEMILLHNPTFDDTSNAVEAFGHPGVSPLLYSYDELRAKLNLGANYGEQWSSLRGEDIPDQLRVTKLEDVLKYIEEHSNPEKPYYYSIDAKMLPSGLGYSAADKVVALAKKMGIYDRVMFGTMMPDVAQYVSRKYPDLTRAACPLEVFRFLDAYRNNADLAELNVRYKILALPYGYGLSSWFRLEDKGLIDYAHKYGIAVQYFTEEDPDGEIGKRLIELGADGVIGDAVSALCDKIK